MIIEPRSREGLGSGRAGAPTRPPRKITPDYESGGQEFLRARQLNQKLRMVVPVDPVVIC